MNPYRKFIEGKDPLQVLSATPDRLRKITASKSGEELSKPLSPGKWSIHQIIAHLADVELVFLNRIGFILFESNKPLVSFEQDDWAKGWARLNEPFSETLERLVVLRRLTLRVFQSASPEELARTARREEFGEESAAEYLERLAGHDLNHLVKLESVY